MSVFPASRATLLLGVMCLAVSRLPAQTADEFFNGDSLQQIRLTMLPADWQSLHEKYLEDTFYPCSFAWNGYELPRIGIRSRGTQSRSPIKPSIGLDFSKYSSSQRFAGLKTVVLRNLNQDASMMHERLAEALFARLGLPHSREAYARLFVNDEYVGVYLMVEPVDARFTRVKFGDDTGYLYDMQNLDFAYHFEYLGPDPALYVPAIFDPKTNTASPDAAGIVEMIRQINEVHDNDFHEVAARHFDLHAAIAHAAAETAVSNWDGVLGIHGMRNFYLYRWGPSRRALFLGWDMDGAFADINWPVFENAKTNVLFRRMLQVPELRRRYLETLDDAAHAMADGNWLAIEIYKNYSLIRQAVYDDPVRLCRTGEGIGRCSTQMFEADVGHLLDFAALRPAYIWNVLKTEFGHDLAAPDLRPGATSTLASDLATLAPGSLAYLRTPINVASAYGAPRLPLPAELGGVSIEIGGGLAKLIEVCPDGVTFVVPDSLPCGPQSLRVIQNGRTSNVITAALRPTATVIFAATHADNTVIAPQSPATEGEVIVLYATGVWTGPTPTLAVTINGNAAPILWAGAAPGFAGLQQLIIQVPGNLGDAGTAKLVVLIDAETGKPFSLPVRH
jgi:uncharacterized protein (TIGR03437 family)